MSEPSQKCDNNAIFKQNYTQKLFISFKISYSCCFGFRGNLEFPDFLQKSFLTSTTGRNPSCLFYAWCMKQSFVELAWTKTISPSLSICLTLLNSFILYYILRISPLSYFYLSLSLTFLCLPHYVQQFLCS